MNEQTAHLVSALGAINQRIPEVCRALLGDCMTVAKQREFAGLLIELGNVLHSHATGREEATANDQAPGELG
ncbi:hypothetical protein OG738_03770 [Amycolatopsis sp. NBC_01488]|uniref:hypothetical protein n=1 Tax=Amycolatopsis sp. NBC_01488 TaxID=2903563 RepID=UPI002E2BBF23|nr:hypothetical protein [Amycolatopsis sp. NBC_01488]